jgi:hypothetical protein
MQPLMERLSREAVYLGLKIERVEVNTLQPLRRKLAQTRSHMRTPIATLRSPPTLSIRIAQTPHQQRPRPRSTLNPPPRLLRLPRKSVTRKSWDDKMERISRLIRIHEFLDNMSEFQNRARPAVGDEQRKGVSVPGADVQEVDF